MKKQKLNYILEQVRKKGRNGDTILAHINPLEAKMLKKIGGSGTINPKTGLPEFAGGFFSKRYWNKGAWKRDVAAIAGNIVGNMIMPGIGGTLGATLGSAVGTKLRNRNDYTGHMLKSAALGTLAPTVASVAGKGANAMGFTNAGQALSNYGTTNAILPSLGFGNKAASSVEQLGSYTPNPLISKMYGPGSNGHALENYSKDYMSGVNIGNGYNDNLSFTDKLGRNTKNFLTEPKNLLSLGATGLALYDRTNAQKPKKELTPTQRGKATKEEMLASRLTPAEMADQEKYELAMEQAKRRNSRKKFLPEERIDIEPLYTKISSPQEYAQNGRWLTYYNNPKFIGQPIRF